MRIPVLRLLFPLLALSAVPPAAAVVSGCTTLTAAVPTIATVAEIVSDGALLLSTIETFVNDYFKTHPSSLSATVIAAIQKAQTALAAGENLANGLKDLTTANLAAAFADFTAAYNDLLKLIAPLGVVSSPGVVTTVVSTGDAGTLGAPSGSRILVIPKPIALRLGK